jgi:TPR repeat protein
MADVRYWYNRFLAVAGSSAAQCGCADVLAAVGRHNRAFPFYAKAAKNGVVAAQYRLGQSYLLGLGVPPSVKEALRWLLKAAEAGETAAQTQLASLSLQGVRQGAPNGLFLTQDGTAGSAEAKALLAFVLSAGPECHRDVALADKLYRESSESGWSRGQLGLAMTLLRDGTAAAALEARDLLQSAAADGVGTAHFLLGVLAESGACGQVDYVAALANYKAAAEAGHTSGQLRYGLALLSGRGTDADPFSAETWLRRAALAGEVQAAAVVGDLYIREGELPPNYTEAKTWYLRAAEGGHAAAARELGRMYLAGNGGPRDVGEAAQWFRAGAERGDETARIELVQLALTRQVGEDDQRTSASWLRQLAEAGLPEAQYNLALCLADGIGAERNDAEAFDWFRRAADKLPIAQFRCGILAAEGRGCDADPEAARRWYLQAAAQGFAEAEVAAGEMLANGRGGPRQIKKALELFVRAAASGHAGAIFAIGLMMSNLRNDHDTALACFRHAAKRGHPTAKIMLVRLAGHP